MALLCYFGHHKCASQWIANVSHRLATAKVMKFDYLDFYAGTDPTLGQYLRGHNIDFFVYANADQVQVDTLSGFRGFHVIRDPRDIIVSGYFSHKNTHADSHWPELRAHRRKLIEVSLDEGLFLEMEFSKKLTTRGVDIGLLDSLANWNYAQPDVLEIKYEDLIADPPQQFAAAFEFIGLLRDERDRALLDQCLNELSFRKLAGNRQAGQENPDSHYRKGVAGDWQNYFTPGHLDFFNTEFAGLLDKLGYR